MLSRPELKGPGSWANAAATSCSPTTPTRCWRSDSWRRWHETGEHIEVDAALQRYARRAAVDNRYSPLRPVDWQTARVRQRAMLVLSVHQGLTGLAHDALEHHAAAQRHLDGQWFDLLVGLLAVLGQQSQRLVRVGLSSFGKAAVPLARALARMPASLSRRPAIGWLSSGGRRFSVMARSSGSAMLGGRPAGIIQGFRACRGRFRLNTFFIDTSARHASRGMNAWLRWASFPHPHGFTASASLAVHSQNVLIGSAPADRRFLLGHAASVSGIADEVVCP